jgi:hypothetical protein
VEQALAIVLVVVVAGAALVALAIAVTSGRSYDEIGRGGLSLRDGADGLGAEPASARRLRDLGDGA